MAHKWLLLRFGGIGDAMCCTVAAKCIKEKYPEDTVDFAVRGKEQVDLFRNLKDIFNKVFEMRRYPHEMMGQNCAKTRYGWENIEVTKEKYGIVIDFVNCVENNAMHPALAGKYGDWMASQNSNFQNWVDIHLGWCRLDPTEFKDKRPVYRVEREEKRWAKKIMKDFPRPWIGLNFFSSSRARTLFNVQAIVQEVIRKHPTSTCFVWDNEQWIIVRDGGSRPLGAKTNIRQSAALVEQFDCFAGADSGFSHIAEALETESVSIYTTVPAWTRNKHYLHSHDIEVDLPCRPCFTLHALCPVNRQRALDSLSERERHILQASNQGIPIHEAANQLNTSPDKLSQEFQAVQAKMDGVASVSPDCVASMTPDMIVDKITEALNEQRDDSTKEVGVGGVD